MIPRIGAVFLPGLLLVAGVGLLVVSPLSWGAGAHAGLRDWQPPLVGVSFALPAIALGWTTLRAVSRKTRHGFLVHFLPLTFGALFLFGGSVVVCGLVGSVPNPETYSALLVSPAVSPDVQPSVMAAQREVQFQQDMSAAGFLAMALLLAVFMFAWLWAASYAYVSAFDVDPLMKFETNEAEEVDGVAMLLRGERRARG